MLKEKNMSEKFDHFDVLVNISFPMELADGFVWVLTKFKITYPYS